MVSEDLSLNKDEDNNDENMQLSTTSAVSPVSSRVAPTSTGLPAQQGSGRFTNLQKYINANEGAGQKIASKLSNATSSDLSTFDKDYNAKTQEIGKGIDEAKNLFNTQGQGFKSQLGAYQQGLNSYKNFTDRGLFDQTGQDVQNFTNSPQFGQFQSLQSGLGLNEDQLKQSQGLAETMAKNTLDKIDKKYSDIQSEKGRYDLLQQSTPSFGQRSTSGGNRLNQMFFQKDPNAVNNLQNSFKQQAADVAAKNAILGTQGASLNDIINQEKTLMGDLNTNSKALQESFYNKLNSEDAFKQVNDARKGLYDDYIQQLQSGKYSQDLANLLGVSNLQTYNPMGNTQSISDAGPVDAKFANAGKISQMATNPLQGQFSTYNINKENLPNYISKSGQEAKTFQDVLTQPDYDSYSALQKLFANQDFANKARGISTLDPAVTKSSLADLTTDVKAKDDAFVRDYANRNYLSQGLGQEVYSQPTTFGGMIPTGGTVSIGPNALENLGITENNSPLAAIQDLRNRYSTWSGANSPYRAVSSSYANLDDYIRNSDNAIKNQNELMLSSGNRGDEAKALQRAYEASYNPLRDKLENIVNTTGVKNRVEIDPTENTVENRFKKFKGLL